MARRLKDVREIKIERPKRAKLSAKEVIKRMEEFPSEGSNSLPLSENVRIEVYIPDLPTPSYRDLLGALEREFTYTFGGCTIVRGLDGSYLSQAGFPMQDKVNIIFTDLPLRLEQNLRHSLAIPRI